MTEREYHELREISWRRPLDTAEEARLQAYLALHPEAQTEWEGDAALDQLLEHLPDVPVSSNFAAQVLQAVDREERKAEAQAEAKRRWWRRFRFLPRLAWAGIVLAVGWFGYVQYEAHQEAELARSLVQFTVASGLNEPSIFQDFEAIQRLGQVPPPMDEELALVLNRTASR